MSWIFTIFLVVLIFVAYQLFQLNCGKKFELALKVSEQNEDKLREFFPHLYPVVPEDMKEEIRDFFVQNVNENMMNNSSAAGRGDLAYYVYLGRYKIINDKIAAEIDSQTIEKMESAKEEISRELNEWDNRLELMVNKRRMSDWERSFILWDFLRGINEQFPERHFDLEDYFKFRYRVFEY